MLVSEGIRQYVEPHCVQRELSEVTGLTADELDHAAHELIRRTASDPTSFPVGAPPRPGATAPRPPATTDPLRRPPYYEHLGGYSFDELKDYNRHSPVEEAVGVPVRRPVRTSSPAAGSWGSSSTAAAAAFRAGGLRTRAYRSDDFISNDDNDYGATVYTTSV